MKHISKFDGYDYEIGYAMSNENGKEYSDDITLIWRDAPCGVGNAYLENISPRELVGWYYGEYDSEIVEGYIKDYWKKKLDKSEQPQLKKMDLPMAYVNFIGDCLDVIKTHKLYALLSGYDDCLELADQHYDEVVERLLKPLYEYGDDAEIILEG